MKTPAKNQHYVPRFYLKSFTDDKGYLYAARRNANGFGNLFRSRAEGVCAKSYLYEVKRRATEGERDFIEKGATESALGEIENKLALFYRDLLGCLNLGSISCGGDCRESIEILSYFISLLITRNPKWLEGFRGNAGSIAAELMACDFLTQEDSERMAEEGLEGEFESLVELAILRVSLLTLCEGSPLGTLVEALLGMDCLFLTASEDSEFVTASFPVCAGWANEDDENPQCILDRKSVV